MDLTGLTYLIFCVGTIGVVVWIAIAQDIRERRPLEPGEMAALARRRRWRAISRYYSFTSREFVANPAFRQTMVADGRFHEVDKDLCEFSSVAAAILKGKKHEWIALAFESERKVKRIWLNKGPHNWGVSSFLSLDQVIEMAVSSNCQTVLVFHNHPNPDPILLDCSKPSEADLESAKQWGVALNERGINLLEFVCERGRHYQYHKAVAEWTVPLRLDSGGCDFVS